MSDYIIGPGKNSSASLGASLDDFLKSSTSQKTSSKCRELPITLRSTMVVWTYKNTRRCTYGRLIREFFTSVQDD